MKRLSALLILLSTLLISSCGVIAADEPAIGFFAEDYLAGFRLSDVPAPSADEEDIRCDGDKVYCNLGENEIVCYAEEIVDYLLAKKDIYHKGYYYETGTHGGVFYLPEYRFLPLKEGVDFTHYWFVYSLDERLNSGGEYNTSYSNGVFISINRESGTRGGFSYNTVIEVKEAYLAATHHTEHSGEWHRSESSHYYQHTCGCPSPDIAELHTDYDENLICDICDYVMSGHEHKTDYTYDEYSHSYGYTCGCPTPPNAASHADSDGDGMCDVCKYVMTIGGQRE